MSTLPYNVNSLHSTILDYSLPKPLTDLQDDNYQLLNEKDLLSKAVEIFRCLFLMVNTKLLRLQGTVINDHKSLH